MNETAVYLSLKLAAKLFAKPIEALAPAELRRVSTVAAKQQEIEALILHTPEAANVVLPAASIDGNLQEIRARYADTAEFHAELQRIGLDEDALRRSVARDMVVEAVLERVGSRAAAVSDTEVEIFWFMHRERFRRAETRVLRHILVTINESMAGSERPAARHKIDAIRDRLLKAPERFAEQALKHSECPTALNGGQLGTLPRGKLYPELDDAAFALPAGGISCIVESELGFHLVLCESIDAEQQLSLRDAIPRIREHLERQRRDVCRKSWINMLRRQAAA